jgi:hypothetical protein
VFLDYFQLGSMLTSQKAWGYRTNQASSNILAGRFLLETALEIGCLICLEWSRKIVQKSTQGLRR